jgi:hypothetical protein
MHILLCEVALRYVARVAQQGKVLGPAGPGQKRLIVNNVVEFASPFIRQMEIPTEILYQK